ncbi:MAG: radical SAM/Cys-rich domain protein [Gammaproteobacteria bacterium]|nr:MAG: radical SAM/Cys-rich domain protein [Gammaproteobacteria bacterium]
MLDTTPLLRETTFPALKRAALETLQVNLGYRCNLSCVHCHVNAGPNRTEMMTPDTLATVIHFLQGAGVKTLDITGGAPELHPQFRELVIAARSLGVEVIDRCNLTVLFEPGQEGTARFLADHGVRIVASLPCYLEENVEQQRGKGVFGQSIEALTMLNGLGYGQGGGLQLDLVYNPVGAHLPPPQASLQADYKRMLGERYGVQFDRLLTITNMPISRFGSVLLSHGDFDRYMQLLKDNYSAANVPGVMCRSLISVDWQGYVYDCDFNQMLNWPMHTHGTLATDRVTLGDLLGQSLEGKPIVVGEHCYGCTAGQGSSCGGALA